MSVDTGSDRRPTATEPLSRRHWPMYIGGEWYDPEGAERLDVVNPATEAVIGSIINARPEHVDQAVRSAAAAQQDWGRLSMLARARLVRSLADVLEENAAELARLDALDNGSPYTMMLGDVDLAVRQLRYFAGLAQEFRGQVIPTEAADSIDFTTFTPFGVVGRIVPFNHPFMFAATKAAIPLITGNTIVLKPSEWTSLSALRFAELAATVLPPGVINVVTGLGHIAGDALVRHPDVSRVAFTGSVPVGLMIQQAAAVDKVKVVSLELGGKNPLIVFGDADVNAAVDGAVRGMNFTWQGQSCGSTSRIYIHRSLWSPFIERMGARLEAMVVGDPFDPASDTGAIVSERQYRRVCDYLETGQADPNARLVTGGVVEAEAGYFVRPTLFAYEQGSRNSSLVNEEIFGPIVVAVPFDTYDEVIAEANRLDVGLTASVWTRDMPTALRATKDLAAGYVWVNHSAAHIPGTPFGGTKNSGVGREESLEEFHSYVQQKNVYINYAESGELD